MTGKGFPESSSVGYLNGCLERLDSKPLQVESSRLRDSEYLLSAFRYVAIRLLRDVALQFEEDSKKGKKMSVAWNDHMMNLLTAVKAHTNVYQLESFILQIKQVQDHRVQEILTKLCHLFALHEMEENVGMFVEDGFLPVTALPLIRKTVLELCQEIRPQAVTLVDAFDIPDFVLNSPLGRSDGDIYTHYLKGIQNSRGGNSVAPYWDSLVRPRVTQVKK